MGGSALMGDREMKIKTSEAERQVLDYLVAKAEGHDVDDPTWWADFCGESQYSTNWNDGGPIIEREKIGIVPDDNDANIWIGSVYEPEWRFNRTGPTPLIAAMRCYVASKLGEEVEVPDGLN